VQEIIVDCLVGIEGRSIDLPEFGQRFPDEFLFSAKALIRVIVQQMIVARNAVVNGFGRVQLEIAFEVFRTESREMEFVVGRSKQTVGGRRFFQS